MIILNRKKDRDLLDLNPNEFFKGFEDVNGDLQETLQNIQQIISKEESIIDAKSKIPVKNINGGDKFYGSVTTTIKDPNTGKKVRTEITDIFEMINSGANGGNVTVRDSKGNLFKTSKKGIKLRSYTIDKQLIEARQRIEEILKKKQEELRKLEEKGIEFSISDTPTRLRRVIEAGIKNIWLCGPAGSGN